MLSRDNKVRTIQEQERLAAKKFYDRSSFFSVYNRYADWTPKKDNPYPDYWGYIPFSPHTFMWVISPILDIIKPKHFVDVGCGVGDKVALTSIIYPDAETYSGIELNPVLYKVFNRISKRDKRINSILGDALKQSYAAYDFIYLYCPIKDPDKLFSLYSLINETANIGTLVLEMYDWHGVIYKFLGISDRMSPIVWRTGKKPKVEQTLDGIWR
jgi:SAM-dependent methyltransferase